MFVDSNGNLTTDYSPYSTGQSSAVNTSFSVEDSSLISELYGQCGLYWLVVPSNGRDIIQGVEGGAYELGYYGVTLSTDKFIEKIQEIDSEGGRVEIGDNSSSISKSAIEILPESVNSETSLEIGTYENELPENPSVETAGVPVYFGPEGSFFVRDVIATIPYDESKLPEGISEDDLIVSCWNGKTWTPTGGEIVDKASNTLSFPTSHFSVFQAGWGKKDNPEIEWFKVSKTQFNALSTSENELNDVLEDIVFESKINDIDGLADIESCYVELQIYSGKD